MGGETWWQGSSQGRGIWEALDGLKLCVAHPKNKEAEGQETDLLRINIEH